MDTSYRYCDVAMFERFVRSGGRDDDYGVVESRTYLTHRDGTAEAHLGRQVPAGPPRTLRLAHPARRHLELP